MKSVLHYCKTSCPGRILSPPHVLCEDLPKSNNDDTNSMQRIINYYTYYMDGALTEFELIGQLVKIPNVEKFIPEALPSTSKMKSIRDQVLELKEAIKTGNTIKIGSNC